MGRNAEAAIIAAASLLAAFGVALVNFAQGGSVDAQVGLTFMVFAVAFGTLHFTVRAFASRATPLLVPPVVALVALGFFQIYRLDPVRAGLQRWWLLIGAAAAGVVPTWWTVVMGVAVATLATWSALQWRKTVPVLVSSIGLFIFWVVGTLLLRA